MHSEIRMLSLASCLVSSLVWAEEARHNMRELCRSEVGGTLLNAYNDVDYLSGLITESKQKIADTQQRRKALELDYSGMQAKTVGTVPVFDLDEKLVTIRFELDAVLEQIRDAAALNAINSADLAKKIAFRRMFEDLIQPVFNVVRAKDSPVGAYDIRTEYKHVCGPYEIVCPLPKGQAQHLQLIGSKLSSPQWCLRYAQLLPP